MQNKHLTLPIFSRKIILFLLFAFFLIFSSDSSAQKVRIQLKNQQKETKQDRYEQHIDWLSYNGSYGLTKSQEEKLYSYDMFDDFDDAMMEFDLGRITKAQLKKKLKKLGVDEYGRPLS